MSSLVKKRKSRTAHKTNKLQEWLSKRKGAVKLAKAMTDAVQLKWGCSRETAIYIRLLENRVRHLEDAYENLDNAVSVQDADGRIPKIRTGLKATPN